MNGLEIRVHVLLQGEHMVMIALAAATVGNLMGLSMEEIAREISAIEAVGGRGKIIETDSFTLIDESYNANPVSMKASLELLALAKTRKVAILGDMFELGEQEEQMHSEIGSYSVERGIDVLICIGKRAKFIANAALHNGAREVFYFETKDEFINHLEVLDYKDTILLKASHGMHFESIIDVLKNK